MLLLLHTSSGVCLRLNVATRQLLLPAGCYAQVHGYNITISIIRPYHGRYCQSITLSSTLVLNFYGFPCRQELPVYSGNSSCDDAIARAGPPCCILLAGIVR